MQGAQVGLDCGEFVALDEAWARTDSYDFNAVVIDYELRNDIAASVSGNGSSH